MVGILDARSKGKNWGRAPPAEGNNGTSGMVLSMDMVSTNYYAVTYTVPMQVGSSQQNFSLQVDTGSSDLWIASSSCSSPSCSATGGRLYDPSDSQSTGTNFTMQYLAGTVEGPIVWDQVQIGDYIIPNQTLAAATTVSDEPLSYSFDGILGLALPLNSLIQQTVSASTGNNSDGTPISSNLFSLTAVANALSQPFFSLTLARPGSSQIPSLLGIGRHPPEIVTDPSLIRYSSLVSESDGPLFWKTIIRAITVYVNGQAHSIALQSLSGTSEPTALLDSGSPLIVTTPTLANGIYGALGIGPASDGNCVVVPIHDLTSYSPPLTDYVPCTTPLNMTITLDGQTELPLHPLDLTTEPVGQSSSQYCTGLIQIGPSQLTATSTIGDMVLGVPFMRNVYTVMAYEQPGTLGSFNNTVQFGTHPTLGLLGLTNITQAMEEFNQVRVLKRPLSTGSSQQSVSSLDDGSQLPVGVKVLIGLGGFFALCLALFALRYFLTRRRWRDPSPIEAKESDQMLEHVAYQSSRGKSRSSIGGDCGSEFSIRKSKLGDSSLVLELCDPWSPHAGTSSDTIIGTEAGEAASPHSSYFPSPHLVDRDLGSPLASPDLTSVLLMAHDRSDSLTSDPADPEAHAIGMAGIGTAARGSVIDADWQHDRWSYDSIKSNTPLRQTGASSLRSSYTLASLHTPS